MVTLFGGSKPEEKNTAIIPAAQEGEVVEKTVIPLSPYATDFLAEREQTLSEFSRGAESTIRVSEVLGSLARLYEKIRNIVEYKGEHVLRRNAIERILRRLLWEHAAHDADRIANVLIRELIWARYVPNDSIPKSKIKELSVIISKYLYLLGKLSAKGTSLSAGQLRSWMWGVASCEIEEAIDPSSREPYVELMYTWFTTYFVWTDETPTEHEKQIQIYLAVHRALAKSDDEIMRYHLLLKEFPKWANAHETMVNEMADQFFRIHEEIEKHLAFADKFTLYRMVKRHTAPFEILKDLVQEEGKNARAVLQNSEKFTWKVREICQRKYALIQKKVNRGILRSVLYIFATKVVLALLIEIPYELYRFGALTFLPLGINVVVPPALMWLIGLTIRTPGEENTQRIIAKLKTVVYAQPVVKPAPYSLAKVSRGSTLGAVFSGIYFLLFLIVFGGITYLLLQLHYTWLGIVIFFAFLSLVLLFGFRVRFTASELKVTSDREGLFGHLFNNLTLPFLSTGVYLSKGLARLNFFTIILDFLIEAPLKTIIEIVEEWTTFIREKREEVVEVPEP